MLGIVQPGFGSSSCCNIIMAYYYGVHTWFSGSWPPYMYPDYNLREVWNEGAHRNGIYIFRRPCINTPYIISIKISTSRVFVGYWGPDIRRVKRVERTARGWLQKKTKTAPCIDSSEATKCIHTLTESESSWWPFMAGPTWTATHWGRGGRYYSGRWWLGRR